VNVQLSTWDYKLPLNGGVIIVDADQYDLLVGELRDADGAGCPDQQRVLITSGQFRDQIELVGLLAGLPFDEHCTSEPVAKLVSMLADGYRLLDRSASDLVEHWKRVLEGGVDIAAFEPAVTLLLEFYEFLERAFVRVLWLTRILPNLGDPNGG